MKRMLLTAMVGLLWLTNYAQKNDTPFKTTWELFNKNSLSIIEMENNNIGLGMLESKLRSVDVLGNGGFSLHYTNDIGDTQQSKIYTFNKIKMLTHLTYIQDLENRDEQIETFLANGFYRKAPYLFYHKTLDLMVKVDFDNKFVSFDYSNKPYIPNTAKK